MQDSSDVDLQALSKHVFQVLFPAFPNSPQNTFEILKIYLQYLRNPVSNGDSWHRRKRILPALQIVYFQNLHFLNREQQEEVLDHVHKLLLDSQVEIRQLAANTLSGLVRCSLRDVIINIRESSTTFLSSVKFPRRSKEISSDMILKCHASVLALGALILAFPYEIMDWMPESLVILSNCVSYISPIGPEVKKIFAEFRRTHQDNWQEDKTKFTEDQLYDLSDLLISPSYYV
jgi:proteasome activator subunit 4